MDTISDKSVIYPSCMRLCIKICGSLYLLTLPGVRTSFAVNHSSAILPYPPDISNNSHYISIHKLQCTHCIFSTDTTTATRQSKNSPSASSRPEIVFIINFIDGLHRLAPATFYIS